MKYFLAASAAILLLGILSCNQSKKASDVVVAKEVEMKMMPPEAITDSADSEFQLPERRFVRTASLKAKVPSVSEAVNVIEHKTRAMGGYVASSHFVNQIRDSSGISTSKDSSLQIIRYNTMGFLTLRVPDGMLDSLLSELRPLSSFTLDREIHADDVSIQLLARQLTRQRALKTQDRLETDIRQTGRRLSDIEQAENTREEKQAQADEAKIAGLQLEDAVRFSTVSLEIYQDPGIRYSEIALEKNVTGYQPPFFDQVGESLSGGWQGFKDFLIFLCGYWVIFILALLGYGLFLKQFHPAKKIETA